MHILITGANGFIGTKLAQEIGKTGVVTGQQVSQLTLIDLVRPEISIPGVHVARHAVDITDKSAMTELFRTHPDVVFHLAAVVSSAAEADFDLGMNVNLMGGLNLLEAARKAGNQPMVILASSVAVHGGEAPQKVVDGIAPNPQSSYGMQKAVLELILDDMIRRGFLRGCALRLPTVIIRPGTPNAAASSFMSSIFRDTLQGDNANCPVGPDFEVWHTAPRQVIKNLLHAIHVPDASWGLSRIIDLPGRTDTIGSMIDEMTDVAGPVASTRITWDPYPNIKQIVGSWRSRFEPEKGLRLGFTQDRSFADSVQWFLDNDIK